MVAMTRSPTSPPESRLKPYLPIVAALLALLAGYLFLRALTTAQPSLLLEVDLATYQPQPAQFQLEAVLIVPTSTPAPTSTPRPTPASTPTPVYDFCGAVDHQPGDVCRMPLPDPTPTPTLPACFSTKATPGAFCQVVAPPGAATPVPAPTNQPPPTLEAP